MAAALKEIAARRGIGLIYKTSFDKANRTSGKAPAAWASTARCRSSPRSARSSACRCSPTCTTPQQCAPVAEVVDVLQIPAFLCRQTDLLVAAAATGRAVNVKKGQFLAPWDMGNVVAKITGAGNRQRAADRARRLLRLQHAGLGHAGAADHGAPTGAPVVFDATHSVQQPGGQGTSSGGQREFVPVLARAAVAVGVAGVFIETHQDPDNAPSDGPNMVPLQGYGRAAARARRVRPSRQEPPRSLYEPKGSSECRPSRPS